MNAYLPLGLCITQENLLKHACLAHMQDRERVVLPRRPDQSSRKLLARLSIAKVMEFTSQSLRSVAQRRSCSIQGLRCCVLCSPVGHFLSFGPSGTGILGSCNCFCTAVQFGTNCNIAYATLQYIAKVAAMYPENSLKHCCAACNQEWGGGMV